MLVMSALLSWTLAQSPTRHTVEVVRPLHDLSFLTGGVAFAVFLGLLIAGIAVPGLLVGLLPRMLAILGLAVAVVAELSTLSLLWQPATYLLPVVRFLGLGWLVVAGFLLPVSRLPRNRAATRAQG